jgi:hypothetical protein
MHSDRPLASNGLKVKPVVAMSGTDRRIRPLGLPTSDRSASPKGFQTNLIALPATASS